jgi:hypothetical protein
MKSTRGVVVVFSRSARASARSASICRMSVSARASRPISPAIRRIFCFAPSTLDSSAISSVRTPALRSWSRTDGGPVPSRARIRDGSSESTPSAGSRRK